jgi:hypothetical protein
VALANNPMTYDLAVKNRTVVDGPGIGESDCRELGVTPHLATKKRYSRLDGRTTRHVGYAISQSKRKRVEEPFGWMKAYGLLRKLRHSTQIESTGTGSAEGPPGTISNHPVAFPWGCRQLIVATAVHCTHPHRGPESTIFLTGC